MVDNFELLHPFIIPKEGCFYSVKLIKRKKDHPEMDTPTSIFKDYHIYTYEDLLKKKDEIVALCNLLGLRAYIKPTPISCERVIKSTLIILAQRIYSNNYAKPYGIVNSAIDVASVSDRIWIVDVDEEYIDKENIIRESIKNAAEAVEKEACILCKVPTKSGFHLLTKPFPLMFFQNDFADVTVHKNNPTVLFIPDGI